MSSDSCASCGSRRHTGWKRRLSLRIACVFVVTRNDGGGAGPRRGVRSEERGVTSDE
jgi:hypothetical protein